jgi:hypothetical protein
MAIDTHDKRRSVIGVMPVADGVIDTQDRPHIAGLYRGIVITPLVLLANMIVTFFKRSAELSITKRDAAFNLIKRSMTAAIE